MKQIPPIMKHSLIWMWRCIWPLTFRRVVRQQI